MDSSAFNLNPLLLSEFFLRILSGFVLGAFIGLERQWRERTSGLRTHALVSCGSSAFAILSVVLSEKGVAHVIIAQIVSGIGFLGAGVIFREGFNLRGINTAATLWCSAGIGALCGVGLILEGFVMVGVVLAINVVLRPVARYFHKKPLTNHEIESTLRFKIVVKENAEDAIRKLLLKSIKHSELRLQKISSKKRKKDQRIDILADIAILNVDSDILESIVSKISMEESVEEIGWELIIGGFE